jgi:peptidoglycan hydrolase-like protein with peptidoglycan-binding domain
MAMLRRGLYGEPVRILQAKLGVDADGVFGTGTEAALIAYQRENGLSADGIAGPDTFTSMGLHELVLLHRPIRGEQVKKLQAALGVDADGVFGPGTEAAVKKFQSEHGLDADGIAGPQTLALVPGFEIPEEKVAASVITESTPVVEPAAIEQAKAEPPPPPPPEGFVAKVGSTVSSAAHTVEEKVSNVGKSIWGTVKSLF